MTTMGTAIAGNDTCPNCKSGNISPAGDRPGIGRCEDCGTTYDRYA